MYISIGTLGKGKYAKLDDFLEKGQGGGVISNPKIYIAYLGNFKQGFFWHENLNI